MLFSVILSVGCFPVSWRSLKINSIFVKSIVKIQPENFLNLADLANYSARANQLVHSLNLKIRTHVREKLVIHYFKINAG